MPQIYRDLLLTTDGFWIGADFTRDNVMNSVRLRFLPVANQRAWQLRFDDSEIAETQQPFIILWSSAMTQYAAYFPREEDFRDLEFTGAVLNLETQGVAVYENNRRTDTFADLETYLPRFLGDLSQSLHDALSGIERM